MDSYPGLTNLVSGHNADDRGVTHAKEIIERYEAKTAVFEHKLVIININKTAVEQGSIYNAARYAWRIAPDKASKAEYVLAVQQGLIIGVFKPKQWLAATLENFPDQLVELERRWDFVGTEGPDEIKKLYLRKRLPESMRKRGAANPVRYSY